MTFTTVYLSLFLFFYLLLLLVFLLKRPRQASAAATPPVSILIAARNEEHTILGCLAALEKLDYPPGKVEVLVGDDSSTDRTWDLLSSYTSPGFSFRCVRITENLGLARGKGNVI